MHADATATMGTLSMEVLLSSPLLAMPWVVAPGSSAEASRLTPMNLFLLACREVVRGRTLDADATRLLERVARGLGLDLAHARKGLLQARRERARGQLRPLEVVDPEKILRKAAQLARHPTRLDGRERRLVSLFGRLLGVGPSKARGLRPASVPPGSLAELSRLGALAGPKRSPQLDAPRVEPGEGPGAPGAAEASAAREAAPPSQGTHAGEGVLRGRPSGAALRVQSAAAARAALLAGARRLARKAPSARPAASLLQGFALLTCSLLGPWLLAKMMGTTSGGVVVMALVAGAFGAAEAVRGADALCADDGVGAALPQVAWGASLAAALGALAFLVGAATA